MVSGYRTSEVSKNRTENSQIFKFSFGKDYTGEGDLEKERHLIPFIEIFLFFFMIARFCLADTVFLQQSHSC